LLRKCPLAIEAHRQAELALSKAIRVNGDLTPEQEPFVSLTAPGWRLLARRFTDLSVQGRPVLYR
jgi:hypothetical protein